MAQNSLSWEKSSQSLEVNWDVWILTTAPCSLGCVEGVSQAQGLGRGGGTVESWKLPDCCFVCPLRGAEVFCCVRLHIILWQAAVQRWRSYQAREDTAVLLLYRAFKVSCICQHSSSEIELTITPLSHLFTVAPASARPQGHVPLHRSPVWVACSRCSIVDFIFPQWGSWPLSIVFSLMWLS